ncbi:cation transporter [Brachybacterium nesterenkovii]|uniref:cation transporter n=1 Tax=Brachybacterium nesterenkovii TaxID=47847 RepID=UPI0032194594
MSAGRFDFRGGAVAERFVQTLGVPPGLVVLLGQPIWAGWLMIIVTAVTIIGPVVLGRMKKKLAEDLHDMVLSADADMNAADWKTAISTIVGVVGIGLGWWWADAVAATIVSISIVKDGLRNLSSALAGLTDTEARTVDDSEPHPLTLEDEQLAMKEPWVVDTAARVRDLGHLFHDELFVVPFRGATPDLHQLDALRRSVPELDWKHHDVVVAPVRELPISQTFRSTLRD